VRFQIVFRLDILHLFVCHCASPRDRLVCDGQLITTWVRTAAAILSRPQANLKHQSLKI